MGECYGKGAGYLTSDLLNFKCNIAHRFGKTPWSEPEFEPTILRLAGQIGSFRSLNFNKKKLYSHQDFFSSCLQETGWDLQRALYIFNQLHSEGKIPPDAFAN